MPGFLADDISTAPLRKTLDSLGHTTYGWDLGRNLGPTPEILDGIVARLDDLSCQHGEIDIIGSAVAIPEPSAAALLCASLGLLLLRRKR